MVNQILYKIPCFPYSTTVSFFRVDTYVIVALQFTYTEVEQCLSVSGFLFVAVFLATSSLLHGSCISEIYLRLGSLLRFFL